VNSEGHRRKKPWSALLHYTNIYWEEIKTFLFKVCDHPGRVSKFQPLHTQHSIPMLDKTGPQTCWVNSPLIPILLISCDVSVTGAWIAQLLQSMGYWLENPGTVDRLLAQVRGFSFFQGVQTGSVAHPTSYLTGTWGALPRDWGAVAWSWPTPPLHLPPPSSTGEKNGVFWYNFSPISMFLCPSDIP
jgi:hypothetical protein